MNKQTELWLTIMLVPVVVVGAWMFGRYGTVSPCGALDQILIDRISEETAPKTAGDYLAIAMVPKMRATHASTPGRCMGAVIKHEWNEIELAMRYKDLW